MALHPDPNHSSLPYIHIAQAALEYYPFHCAQIVFLQHNSGVTFRLECAGGEKYLLKLHQSVNGEPPPPVDTIQGQMQWLADLHATTGLTLQVPIRNRQNHWITPIFDPQRSGGVPCTVQEWVDGDPPRGGFTLEQLSQLGELMAQIHAYSIQYPDSHSAIPAYSLDQLHANIAALHQAVGYGLLSEPEFSHLAPARDAISVLWNLVKDDSNFWGPIHSDIHYDNVLFDQGEIRIIDFDGLVKSPYCYDLGVTMYHIEYQGGEARQAFLNGYQRKRTLSNLPAGWIETCIAWAAIDNLAFQITIPQQRAGELFKKNLQHLVFDLCGEHG